MSDFKATPHLTEHARQRCAEMGVSTKVAKRIARDAEVCYPGRPTADGQPTQVCLLKAEPDYCAVTLTDPDGSVRILTLLFNTNEPYDRAGTTYVLKSTS